MLIKKLSPSETTGALRLVWDVFIKFEAPDYCKEGVDNFKRAIDNQKFIEGLVFYGAFEEEKLVGVAATRNDGNHIALFFVDGEYHRRGIGRSLFKTVLQNNTSDRITVNSSPYAVEVYRHLGFAVAESEKVTDGIRYTPMAYSKK